ncbi:VanZ family protein [Luteolibacter sp. AS25]|uniref:VanZ family protein n=1 Tax=Luteolibacter sp. AS25 TaxID=3135776 RepID=UPI00398A976A
MPLHLRKSATSPRLWLAAFIFWAVTLYILSSFKPSLPPDGPEIPYFDKIAHFGYFFGGGILLGTFMLLKKGPAATFAMRIIVPLVILAVIGALDEFHQTFTPGRSGNDLFDWCADVLGATTGVFIGNSFHHRLQHFSSAVTEKSSN